MTGKGPSIASVPKEGPQTQKIADLRCVAGQANVTTWDAKLKKMGVRKPEIYADKAKGKRKLAFTSYNLQLAIEACICKHAFAGCKQAFASCNCKQAFAGCKQAFAACNYNLHLQLVPVCKQASKHLQIAFACICKHLQVSSKHLQLEFAAGTSLQASICRLHLQPFVGCKQAFAACIYSLQLQLAFVACNYSLQLKLSFACNHLQVAHPFACTCSNQCIYNLLAFASTKLNHLHSKHNT
ncbi:hypothetical protein Tco_1174483 [Tanacetum coccineum]